VSDTIAKALETIFGFAVVSALDKAAKRSGEWEGRGSPQTGGFVVMVEITRKFN